MRVYMLMIMVLLFASVVLKPERSDQRRKYFLLFSFILLFVISAFRDYSVGMDTKVYISLYSVADKINVINDRWEPGFIILLKMLRQISSNPAILLFVSSGICIGCTFIFIKKFSGDVTIAVILYVLLRSYFSQMSAMRQMLATAFCMLAFMYLIQGKKLVAAGFILLATSMHTVAILAFIPYVIWIFKGTRFMIKITLYRATKWIIFILTSAFVAYPIVIYLVKWLFPQYSGYFTGQWGEANYFASLINTVIEIIFLIVGAHYFSNKELEDIERFSLIILICSISFFVLSMRMEIWNRVAGMFRVYTAVLWVPAFVCHIQNRTQRLLMKNLIIGFSWLYLIVILIYRPGWDGVIPYTTR